MIYQMMNGRISKRTLTKMIKAYYMCAQNGVVYKGYTEWTGDKLSYVRKYILCKCADRRIDSKNIDEGCGTDELDIVWLNDGLLLIAEKDAVVQGRTLNRAFYRLPVNNETDKKSADVKNTVHNKISNKDLESLKPERIFAGNLVVLKIESTSDGSNELVDIIDEDIEFIESVLRTNRAYICRCCVSKEGERFRTEERRLRYEDRVQTKLGNRARSIIKAECYCTKK